MPQKSPDEVLREIAEYLSPNRELSATEIETLYSRLSDEQKEAIVSYEVNNEHLSAASGNEEEAKNILFEYIVRECRKGYKKPNVNCPFESEDCYVGDRCIHCCMNEVAKVTGSDSEGRGVESI